MSLARVDFEDAHMLALLWARADTSIQVATASVPADEAVPLPEVGAAHGFRTEGKRFEA